MHVKCNSFLQLRPYHGLKKKILLAYISSFPSSPSFHFCQSCVSVPFIITMSEYIREDGEEETGIES